MEQHVLWTEKKDSDIASELPYRVIAPDDAATVLDDGQEICVVIIGTTIEEPLSLAQRLSPEMDDTMELLIVCNSERIEAMKRSLRLTPFVGPHTRAIPNDEKLHDKIAKSVSAVQSRRRHRQVIERTQSVLGGESSGLQRPSPRQYASAMWTAAPVGTLAVTPDSHHIVNANNAATRLFGQREIDLIGQRLEALFDTTDDEWRWLSQLDGNAPTERLLPFEGPDDKLHLQLRAMPVSAIYRDIVLLFLWDITDRVRFEQLQSEYLAAERHARQEAEKASEIRENVLATVAHDLRSPLTTLMTSSQLLQQQGDSLEAATLEQLAGSIQRSSKFMANLVDDLVDIARIEGDRLSLQIESVRVGDIVEQAIEFTRGDTEAKDIEIDADDVQSELTMRGDETRLLQMLENLLSNAIKFSPASERIDIEAHRYGSVIRMSVRDRGPGIPAEQIPYLFDHFWKEDRRDELGLGLGLAIVRGIVDAHDGDITVDSTPGKGTTFHVDLPVKQQEK